jgi:LytS/YehU family sensor histidine kinase
VATPIKLAIFHLKFSGMPDQQDYIRSHQIYHYLISVFVGAASAGVKITGDWLTNQQDKKELEHRTIQSELNFLKSQINPHFLFNTLNSLYALTLRKSDNAPEIVLKLSEMMRYMLYECNEKRVPLSKEVNYLRNYLDLELLRHGNGIDVQFEINGEISDQQIAPLLFIPFLENCFKHGLKNRISKGFVKIRLDVFRYNVQWHIENSKPEAIPMKDSRPSGGIGLVNVRRRLDILYTGHYQLAINDNPNTYEVDLKIDLTD